MTRLTRCDIDAPFPVRQGCVSSAYMSELSALVLAAGHGKRMKSAVPKVMHAVSGRPLVHFPISCVLEAGADRVVVVVGHERGQVEPYLRDAFADRVTIAVQHEQRGTGHAAQQGLPALPPDADLVLVVYGDTPLLLSQDLRALADALTRTPSAKLAMLTCRVADPRGYGRILRDDQGRVVAIREDRDLDDTQRAVDEVNPGVYCARASFLREALARLRPDNAQGELYLTDIVAMAAADHAVADVPGDPSSLVGVNDRAQLALADRIMQERIIDGLRRSGVTIRDGAHIDHTVEIEPDATIETQVVLRGKTRVAARARIDVGTVIVDASIGPDAMIKPYCVITSSTVEAAAQIGPFAHLRPQTVVGEGAHVGNFVETKKTILHKGAKANHLSYLGDGDIGAGANIGAGTIFCNYDGFQKHKTVIGEGAFVGSDSQIVAPVTIGEHAYVATGTTVTRDVPPDALAIARVKQENKEGYALKLRQRFAAAKAAKQNPSGS